MKKAKIMLSAIAVFAVVSGALAFRAHAKNDKVLFLLCNTGVIPHTCTAGIIQPATDISTILGTRNETFTYTPGLTLDAGALGNSCTNATHPCTTTALFYQSTVNSYDATY